LDEVAPASIATSQLDDVAKVNALAVWATPAASAAVSHHLNFGSVY